METYEEDLMVFETVALKEALHELLLHMRCSQEGCKEVAKLMYKNTEHDKDLRCGEDFALADCSKDYKPLDDYWPEIEEKVDNLQHLIRQTQVLLSAMGDQYYVTKFSEKERKGIDLITRRLHRWVSMFPIKIYGLKNDSNFDVFIEMHKESKSVESDTTKLNQIVGPLLALIYSTSVLKQISSFECDKTDDLEGSMANLEENKQEIFQKSNGPLLLEAKRVSELESKFSYDNSEMSEVREERTAFHLKDVEEEKELRDPTEKTLLTDIARTEESKEMSNSIVTVFAATFDDISNCSVNYKDLIDFMHDIRDSNLELREEIDNYMEKNDLKPSQEYENNRVVPDIKEVTEIIRSTKIDKNCELNTKFKLVLDLRRNKKPCRNFMREVKEFQMPKIHSLTVKNIHRIEPNDFNDYQVFMRHTMASDIREFFFHTGNDIALAQFNHSISNILTLVNYQALFSNFILTNEDLVNIFINLVKSKHLEFDGCNFEMVTEDLNLTQVCDSRLESITIRITNKKGTEEKVMQFLRILCLSLKKTPVRASLNVLYIPKFLNISEVKTLFKDNRYRLKDIQCNT
ncbi:unnamed protein product [Moneuplotes crassus]|uniref:Uncharacterized protein n=3 Tax=Euplotes crassus TaxID=5936 RepID=A0AAD1X647_EUPCR|nr:unnamed protein product [Moneuplotes crassus]